MVPVRDHLAHQRRIFRRDVVAHELGHVRESHDPVVEADPFVHLAELHVADHVIQRLEVPRLEVPRRRARGTGGPGRPVSGHRPPRHVAGQVRTVVTGPVDEAVPGLTVGGDRCQPNGPMLVTHVVRRLQDRGALMTGARHAPVDVRHLQGDVGDPVTVPPVVLGDRAAGGDRAPEHESDRPAAQYVRVVVPVARLRPGVGDQFHAEGELVVQRGLGGVADGPHHRVPAGDRERVPIGIVGDQADELPELIHVKFSELFLAGQGLVDAHGWPPHALGSPSGTAPGAVGGRGARPSQPAVTQLRKYALRDCTCWSTCRVRPHNS